MRAQNQGAVEMFFTGRRVEHKLLAMSIVIENPTAESIYRALQDVAPEELSRLKEMLLEGPREETIEEEEAEWRRISAHSAARFLEEEEGV